MSLPGAGAVAELPPVARERRERVWRGAVAARVPLRQQRRRALVARALLPVGAAAEGGQVLMTTTAATEAMEAEPK